MRLSRTTYAVGEKREGVSFEHTFDLLFKRSFVNHHVGLCFADDVGKVDTFCMELGTFTWLFYKLLYHYLVSFDMQRFVVLKLLLRLVLVLDNLCWCTAKFWRLRPASSVSPKFWSMAALFI